MFDSTAPRMQRATGHAGVGLVAGPSGARLCRLGQSGSAKAFLPRVHGTLPEVVFLNTAGGLTGGDRIGYALDLGPGARAVGTTQTAERAYAASAGRARLDVALTLGAGASLDWLPQETILFDGSALDRRTRADLGAGARLLLVEWLVLGRLAMGEVLGRFDLDDAREVWREGRPVLIEPLRLCEAVLGDRPALLAGARAVATVALVAPGAEDALGPVREAIAGFGPEVAAAASGWDGKCVVRLRATEGWPLRRAVARLLGALRGGAALPRVWQVAA